MSFLKKAESRSSKPVDPVARQILTEADKVIERLRTEIIKLSTTSKEYVNDFQSLDPIESDDGDMDIALFAWGLMYDTAFLRSLCMLGFDTLEQVIDEGMGKFAPMVMKVRNEFVSTTLEEFINPERWPLKEAQLNEQISLYESWMFQLLRSYLHIHRDDEENEKNAGDLLASLRSAATWQVTCDSQRAHFRAHWQDIDRLNKEGRKMTLKEISVRVYSCKGMCGYEEHPDYPQKLLGRMKAK